MSIYFPLYTVYLLVIISLIFFSRKKPVQRFSWIMVLVLIPVIGLLLYLFLGSDTLAKYRKKRIETRHGETLSTLEEMVNLSGCNSSQSGVSAHAFLERYCGSCVTNDNAVTVFTDGAAKYDRLFNELRAAKDNIHVQYFSISNDAIGKELIDILAEKVRAGVEVKLLYDQIGCLFTAVWPLLRKLKQVGAKVISIRPHALDLNYRNHRKIVVIDGLIGYTGGMNIGKKYRDGNRGRPWRDTHLRITGSAVLYLQKVFLADWFTAARGSGMGLRNDLSHYFPAPEQKASCSAQIIANGLYNKYDGNDIINFSYFYLLSRAKSRIWIQTPYFAPSDIILQTLKGLASAGVDVRIMTSSSYAFGGLFHSSITNFYLRYLVDSGVKVYKYNGILHAKTMLLDDDAVCIGTVNLNSRSLSRDDEIYGYFSSPAFVAQYDSIFANDFANSLELDYEKFRHQPLPSRAFESVMSFFSSVS